MDDFEAALAAKFAAVEETGTADEPESEVVAEEEVEAAAAEEPVESEEVEEDEGPQRDEKGRFVAKERPEWLPPQFKSEEDFARQYAELEKVIGRQGHELGELRKLAEQIAAEPRQQAPIGQVQAALDENPEAVAYWAAENGNEAVLDQALAAWTQKAIDEGDATALRDANKFEREIEFARLRYEFSQEVQPSIEQVKQESGKRALAIARRELASKYPDFDQVMESVTEAEVAGLNPHLLGELQKTDPKAALETIYRWVAVERTAQSTAQDAAVSEAARQESLERKRQATVATSTLVPASGEKTNVERFKEMLLEPDEHSVHHGLTS